MSLRQAQDACSAAEEGTQTPVPAKNTISKKRGRSNAGCGNCKKRKIKCDERKPTCSRCDARRIKCPGYPTSTLKWSSKHEVHPVRSSGSVPTPAQFRAAHRHGTFDTTSVPSENSFEIPVNWDLACLEPMRQHVDAGADVDCLGPLNLLGLSASGAPQIQSPSPTLERRADGSNAISLPATPSTAPAGQDELLDLVKEKSIDHASPLDEDQPDVQYSFPGESSISSQKTQSPRSWQSDNMELGFSAVPLITGSESSNDDRSVSSIPSSLLHIPTILVEYYFQKVCRDCSTYDSSSNPFRTVVSEMRISSASLNYAIQSLAASKLAGELPRMKIAGIEAQGLALESLKNDCLAVDALHDVSDAGLCTILLLGMTTSWHVPSDIGLGYLALAQRIITAKIQAPDVKRATNLEFHVNALKYWEMIVSIVSSEVESFDDFVRDNSSTSERSQLLSPSAKKIMPHPWTGVSPESQQLFGSVLRLIRRTRATGSKVASTYSRAGIMDISNAIAIAERLEAECWSVSIPSVDDLNDTKDPHTSPIHHVLTAKAYLLSALLHIYMIFPDVLETRIQVHSTSETTLPLDEETSSTADSARTLSMSYLWSQRLLGDPREMWLRDIGLKIVQCLEDISVRSGTRVVHPPLLLSVASVLRFSQYVEPTTGHQLDGHTSWDLMSATQQVRSQCGSRCDAEKSDARVRQCRSFIITRLEAMHALMRFDAIENVLMVVKEVWRRADAGVQDVFWMDIMYELRCETLFG